jgi:16S rRNA (guanine(966)-N(2))-methyltransferase RsmD
MRVIAGTARGRRLKTLKGQAIRPTADRVKEALFSIVQSRFDLAGAAILDLFAGSGALGIEALSRGAARVTFVEESAQAASVLADNVEAAGFAARSGILRLPASRALDRLSARDETFGGILLDPPYGRNLVDATLRRIAASGVVGDGGWVMAEHHCDDAVAENYGDLQLTRTRRYGKTSLALFSKGLVHAEDDRQT